MPCKITPVKNTDVKDIWYLVKDYTNNALCVEPLLITIDQVYRYVCRGYYKLWVAINDDGKILGAGITKISKFPACSVVEIITIGGCNSKEWLAEMFNIVENYAKDNNCKYVVSVARDGWLKMKPDYKKYGGLYSKEIV